MAKLTAIFEMIDNMSAKLDAIADSGSDMVTQLEEAGDAANSAFDAAESGGTKAAQSVDGVASSADSMSDSMDSASRSMEGAADSTDYWTAAVGNYDKEALEAIYTTEELVEMGFKSEEALEAEARGAETAEDALEDLEEQAEDTGDAQEDMGESGVDAFGSIAGALAAAGITAKIKEIAEAAYELVGAFSEAESTVVIATGASGSALDGLTDSMMKAYAASKTGDLGATAAAVGEINTRLGYTGQKLTDTTDLFLDFAAVTGGQASSSVRSVTQLMNQWNISADELEGTMDKLTYAGQASGISVDGLTSQLTSNKAILDQLGFSLDESIAMFSQFELSGTQSATVMTGLRTALANGTISSLEDLYQVFGQISDGSLSAADAADIFGKRAGPQIVNAVNQGVFSLDSMVSALENTSGTTKKTAEAAQTLDQKWTQASNNINAAFTSAMEPAVSGVSSALAGVVDGIGTFLNEHPAVTKAITAIAVGVGAVVAGFALYTIAQGVATAATALFGVTLSAAIWPLTAIAAAIAAVTAAVLFLVDAFQEDMGETEGMTASTRDQYYALQDLNAEYEEACAKYGETSEEASRLKYQLDDMEAAFEANRQTVEEFTAEMDALCSSVHSVTESYNSAQSEIRSNEVGAMALIQKYEDLASKTNRTAAEEQALAAVTKQLSTSYPDLANKLNDATGSTEDYVTALKKACEAEAEEQRQQQAQETYIEALKKREELTQALAKAQENVNLEQARMDNMSGWEHFWTGGEWDDLEAYQAALEELNAAMAENDATIAEIEQGWQDLADAEEEAGEQAITYEEAAAAAYESVRERVEELCAAYDEAYTSAKESFEGQFGLFDEAQADMDATVASAQAALDSQLAYWEAYGSNIETLKNTSAADLGITQENYDAIMAQVQDGSEQAAGLAASMVEAINSGDTEAVAALANTLGEIQSKQDQIAAMTADWKTNFDEQMQGIVTDMEGYIDDLELSDEAAANAKATVASYAESIRSGKADAVAAAKEIADAVTQALSSANPTIKINVAQSSTPGHATGTTNAEDVFIAGENGPELIVGKAGSTVFPTSETDRIINAVNDNSEDRILNAYSSADDNSVTSSTSSFDNRVTNYYLPEPEAGGPGGTSGGTEDVKKISLEIGGGSPIEINGKGGGVSQDEVVEILIANIRPALINIVKDEIFEEGDGSYEH